MFDVFVSYAHEDVGLASALASGLGRIGKPWWRRRSLRVFRDANVMTASADLWDSIRGPLEESRWFVAVISPAAAASPWVAREIAWWVENRGDDQLLVVLADGTCCVGRRRQRLGARTRPRCRLRCGARSMASRVGSMRRGPPVRRSSSVVTVGLIDLLAELAAPVQGTDQGRDRR